MATLDKKNLKKIKEKDTLAAVADMMRVAKYAAAEAEAEYKRFRLEFLALMGDEKEAELEGFHYSVTRPVSTTFNGAGLIQDHPEAAFLVKVEEVVTTTYSLDEDTAHEAISSDKDGVVLELIKEYVVETPGAPRVNIKEISTDE